MKKFSTFLLLAVLIVTLLLAVLTGCGDQQEDTIEQETPVEEIEEIKDEPQETEPPQPTEAEAKVFDLSIYVDGSPIYFDAYSISGQTHIKLRDLAYVLNGTRCQFAVDWDSETKTISLTSGQPYTPAGGELSGVAAGNTTAQSVVAPILVDGGEAALVAYTINGTNYFGLRDLGQVFDFCVDWDGEAGRILVDTSVSYGEKAMLTPEVLTAQLQEAYEQIINDRNLYDEGLEGLWDAENGLAYADIIDFSDDGLPELLLISLEKHGVEEEADYKLTLEVYGNVRGHVDKCSTVYIQAISSERTWIKLFKSGERAYIGRCGWGGGTDAPWGYEYYGFDGETLYITDYVVHKSGFVDAVSTERMITYYDHADEITEEQFEVIQGKYVEEEEIMRVSFGTLDIQTRGMLPEKPGLSITVNGEVVNLENELFLEKGYVMLPLRPIMEKAGVAVCANSSMDTILATTKRDTLEIADTFRMWGDISGEFYMNFNGEGLSIGGTSSTDRVEPRMLGGELWVPIKPLIKLFGGDVNFDTATKTYAITLNIPAADQMSQAEAQDVVEFTLEDAKRIALENGYIFTPHPMDEWDAGQGFTNGKAYWWMCVLPVSITKEEANKLFWEGVDKYETVTVWNDGTVTR